MEESNEEANVVPELYFLIAKFLSGGPLKETAKTLLKELESVEVLPRRLDWEGNDHAQSYDELAAQYSDVSWRRLAAVCERALQLASSEVVDTGTSTGTNNGTISNNSCPTSSSNSVVSVATGGNGTCNDHQRLRLRARLSLLSESLVRPKPKYSAYKQDHTLVRRLANRELGGVTRPPGRPFPARLLSGLQLQRRTLGHLSAVYCLVFDCTGRYVVTVSGGAGPCLGRRDGDVTAACVVQGADDLLVKVWCALDGRLLSTLRGAGAEITDVCASADGALLACGSVERLVRVWCLATGAPRAVLHAHAGTITSVHWAPPAHGDVRWLASTSTDGSVAFWTCAADGQFLSRPVQFVERMRPGACHMICAAWSAGGAFLAAGSADHHVRVYCLEAAGPRRVLETAVHGDAVDSIAWAHRGLRLVSGSKDGSAALWTLHATQWRHVLLQDHTKRLKVTMVCWDRSDAYVLTAVSDNTVRVWCSRSCRQVRVLQGHLDEAYVLEAHPLLGGVVLSAGHDGQLFVWDLAAGEPLARFHNRIEGQGDGAIFDAKWGGGCSVAASDSHGHLLLLGLGLGHRLLRQLPAELFFHTDYRPLVRDALGGALDEQTETPPHLMPPPFLVDVEGAPHAPQLQRLVPGRERLALRPLLPRARAPAATAATAPPAPAPAPAPAPHGPWRGEGVRHTAGSWQREDSLPPCDRPVVQPLPESARRAIELASTEMNEWECAWYRREMRRRPLMISTLAEGPARRAGRRPRPRAAAPAPAALALAAPHRPRPRPRPRPRRASAPPSDEPPSAAESRSSSDTSDESVRLSASAASAAGGRSSQSSRTSRSSRSYCSSDSDSDSSSASSQYSDWQAGPALAPPARARRRPQPTARYSPSTTTTKRGAASAVANGAVGGVASGAGSGAASGATSGAASGAGGDLPEAYRVGEWLTAVTPRKAPYQPQMGDHLLYFRLGHQRYFEAVAEKDVYKINPRDKPWEMMHIYECESAKVVGIKYVIKPPRVVCLRLASVWPGGGAGAGGGGGGGARSFTVRYHDMPDVIDFLVLKQQYDAAMERRWGPGDRFRCMIDDSWWTGIVLERTGGAEAEAEAGAGAGAEGGARWAAAAAAHFLSLRVRWDNGEVERLSPWDLEPLDPQRLPEEPGGAVRVLPAELAAVAQRADALGWPAGACRALARHTALLMTLSAAEPFVAPVDLQLYPSYARLVPYPVDLSTIRARFENLYYRRPAAAQFDARCLASNAERFNEPHSPIVRQARLVTDLLLYIISNWRNADVVAKYHELAAAYQSSDDEPLAAALHKGRRARGSRARGAGGGAASARAGGGGEGSAGARWVGACGALLHELSASADAEPFRRPVEPSQAPDYLRVVSSPMDLGTVRERLEGGAYSRPEQFARDVRLVFSNSRLYNTNKRSRIYSMTVRLSSLFEALWARVGRGGAGSGGGGGGGGGGARGAGRTTRRAARRSRRAPRRNTDESGAAGGRPGSSSESEPLAATSRRVHAARSSPRPRPRPRPRAGTASDSDAPLHAHRKGKGVGKKSKTSSSEPMPSTSHAVGSQEGACGAGRAPSEGSERSHIEVLEEELADDEVELTYEPAHAHQRTRRKRARARSSGSSGASQPPRPPRPPRPLRPLRPPHKRVRERFASPSGSSSGSGSASGSSARSGRRYESDRSYRPRYSTDDDAPLLLYRQRQEGDAAAGPSGRGHSRSASLRARRSPRRYNEDSEEDSIAAISKRLPHHHQHHHHQHQLARRRQHHATQGAAANAAHTADHNYFNGHAHEAHEAHEAHGAHGAHNGHARGSAGSRGSGGSAGSGGSRGSGGSGGSGGPVSISSRGRVRRLTAKARGLLRP
ncbi:unnamed protein product, partial [Iphiclides podalirius]